MTLNPLRLSPFQRVIASLLLGVAVGVFVGEPAGKLEVLGDIYIKLLQMTVIPYIIVSLVGGLGRLDMAMARRIAISGGGLILALWALSMLTLLLLPLAYPTWTSASFFSGSLISQAAGASLLDLYIPANPFHSMANTIVPAIVLFSIFLGVAMITVNNKDGLLHAMGNLADALMKIASVVARTAPIGIFALSAAAAGTLDVMELSRLQVYLWVYLAAWLVLAIFTLPMLVAWATPFSYRQVMSEARLIMVTAFATGTVLVVLPMIAERSKALLQERDLHSEEAESAVDVLVPTAYSFPSVGTLMGIGFILFAAWFYGSPLSPAQYPAFTIMGVLSAFGTMAVALPFMLDFFELPADLFGLYLIGSVFTMRFATAMAALHGIVISLMGACAMTGQMKWRKVAEVSGISLLITALVMAGLGVLLTRTIPYEYTGYKDLIELELKAKSVATDHDATPSPLSVDEFDNDRLVLIRERGSLRVGYSSGRLPFTFRNKNGHVVGHDIELVNAMAKGIGVSLKMVKLPWSEIGAALEDGRIDLAVGGISISTQRALDYTFSRSYRDETLGLIVADHRRNEFANYADLLRTENLALGATPFRHSEGSGQIAFPDAEIVVVDDTRAFLRGDMPELDAMLYTAETAAAWTLVYPQWTVVVPGGLKIQTPMGFLLPNHAPHWASFVNTWIDYHIKSGMLDKTYRYWILGETKKEDARRWSVIRDVLGWVN